MTRFIFLLAALALPGLASALDYKSLSSNAIVYDAGSVKAQPQFILLKGTPVEVIVSVDKWIKIREQSGGLGWVERAALSDTRQVIVTTEAEVRLRAEENAPLVFSATKDVVLEVLEKPTGAWVKVKHRDGQSGYVPIKSVWGI
ncbi:MAG: hypothetical protein H6R19_2543 [Proteobacteria bacterium]|nr:hypothetical protein [Pseudomonadota bacterium]